MVDYFANNLSSFQSPHASKSPTTSYIPVEGAWSPAGGYKVAAKYLALSFKSEGDP